MSCIFRNNKIKKVFCKGLHKNNVKTIIQRDCKLFDILRISEDNIAVSDRGYFYSLQFNKFCETDIQFMTKIKSSVSYSVCVIFGADGMETNKFIILKDKLIYFSKGKIVKNCSETLRLVISHDKEREK